MPPNEPTDESEQIADESGRTASESRGTAATFLGTTRRRVLSYGAALGVLGLGSAAAGAQDETPTETPTGETATPADGTTETPTDEPEPTTFRVRIENVSSSGTLAPSDGSEQAVPISPGAYAVHTSIGPMFVPGVTAPDNGLENVAEDGNPALLTQSLAGQDGIVRSGAFDTPADADSPGPIEAGGAYEFTVEANPGQHLSFATMFIPSNDIFFAPGESGVSLFDETGQPVEGSITSQIQLWDAGTEANEEPGVGPNQAQRQSEADTGEEENEPVLPVSAVDDGYEYPDVSEVIEVTVTPIASLGTPAGAETAGTGTETTETETEGEAATAETPEGTAATGTTEETAAEATGTTPSGADETETIGIGTVTERPADE